MKVLRSFLLVVIAVAPVLAVRAQDASPQPPVAAKQPKVTKIHGYTRTDDYHWMRERDNPAVQRHLEAENAYTDSVMEPTEPLQKALYNEMVGRIKQTDETVPYRSGDWLYWSRTMDGQQYPHLVRRAVAGGAEESLLDVNAMATGHGYYSLGAVTVSDDGNLLAYSVDTTGYRQYVLRVKDLRTGKELASHIARVGSVVWATDNHTLFVTTEDSVTKRSDKFWRHKVGTDSTSLVFEERDEEYEVYADRARDRSMVFVGSYANTSTEFRYVRANNPDGTLSVILPRRTDHEYYPDADRGRFYIRTNRNAKTFRIVSAPLRSPGEANWRPFVATNPRVTIEDMDFFARHVVLSERENGLTYLRVIDKATGAAHRIATPEPVYTLAIGANRVYDADTIQVDYSSMVTPPSTFAYDLRSRARTLLKQQDVFNYDRAAFESQRVWVPARDGTRVPVALVYRKDTPLDGSAPMLLYSYGSYGSSVDPDFSPKLLSLLDRGWVYAIASVRGGGELGEPWRDAGRMMRKMNTFTDFIDVAEYLERKRFTSADRMMIQGESAGGLLMGVVANMRPDLFRAVVAAVPFVDVMNSMLDPTLPLTTGEYTEWGNPNRKDAYDYMMRYSPYDNVRRQAYPAMLIEVSLNDSQVPYWEGLKLAAKIREMNTGSKPVLVNANMGAGHSGASGRYDLWKEVAFQYAFLLSQAPAAP